MIHLMKQENRILTRVDNEVIKIVNQLNKLNEDECSMRIGMQRMILLFYLKLALNQRFFLERDLELELMLTLKKIST